MENQEYKELKVSGIQYRIKKKRSFKYACMLDRAKKLKGDISADDIIIVDCEIFDRKTKQWRDVADNDMENISETDGVELFNACISFRFGDAADFQKPQPTQDGGSLTPLQNDTAGQSTT